MRGKRTRCVSAFLVVAMAGGLMLQGCSGNSDSSGKTEIEILQYKPEAATYLIRWKNSSMQLMMISI